MQVSLTNTRRGCGYLDLTVKWRSPIARAFGELQFTLPRDNALWSSAYLDENGGSLVEIEDARLGYWRGITMTPEFTDNQLRCKAVHINSIVNNRIVSTAREFISTTAAIIVQSAFNDALNGVSGLDITAGSYVESAPLIPQYSFTGQTFSQVLTEIMDVSNQEWSITDNGVFNWTPPSGNFYTVRLTESHDIIDITREGSLTETVTEVIARSSDGQEYTAQALNQPSGAFWKKQVTISSSSNNITRLAIEAENKLTTLQFSNKLYKGNLAQQHWTNLREGDYIQIIAPKMSFSGECFVGRVLSREYRTGDQFMLLEINPIPEFTATTPIALGAARTESGVFVPQKENVARVLSNLSNKVYNLEARQ